MNKDQKLLEECYNKVLQEETNLEKALNDIKKDTEAALAEREKRKEEKLKDLSKPVTDELGHDEKGNFIYKPSQYEHGTFYKSYTITNLFDKDLKEVDNKSPIKEGMLWTEQGVNTVKVYRAISVHGRLMRVEVPEEEVKKQSLNNLITEKDLQRIADQRFQGDIDVARGHQVAYQGSVDFNVKRYSLEQILKGIEALKNYFEEYVAYEGLIEKYKKAFKERETDAKLSKDFDVKALEDF